MTVTILLGCVAAFLIAAVFAVALSRLRFATFALYGVCLATALVALSAALAQLVVAPKIASSALLPIGLPWIGAHFRVDSLSAFFIAVLDLGAAAASLFALGYGRHEDAPHRVLPFYAAFLGAMNLVLLAHDAFTFLLSWEVMSLTSWALVIAHHKKRENVEAGYVYLVMASFGTLCLLLAFGLLAGGEGRYVFDLIRAAPPPTALSGIVLLLALLGAGSKAGLVPLHAWLPLAHPAAPSHVSALMSGVMTKVAVYGFIRIVFDLVGPPVWWWSIPVLALGALSAVTGVLFAVLQQDVKRILAYSTIENIGFIVVSLGLALAFRAQGMLAAAALALSAALFHVFNHALFKTLLFCGAGAVMTATGERDLNRLGALIHRMPGTAVVFLAGCAAISALPPFNGFVSEWLTLQAVLLSPQITSWTLKIMVPAVGALLALSAALAGACFVRLFGLAFLGRARSPQAESAGETDAFSLGAMAALAGLCLLAGAVPGVVLDTLAPTVDGLLGARMPVQTALPWLSIVPIAESRSSYNGLLVGLFIVSSAWIAAYAIHRLASHAVRRAPPWDCGFPDASPVTQYGAASFAQPIRRVFAGTVFRVREEIDMPPPADLRPARIRVDIGDTIWNALYAPVEGLVMRAAEKLNYLQFLTIRSYLSLVFIALILLLMVLALWS